MLLVVGLMDKGWIGKFRRTAGRYEVRDFDVLTRWLAPFSTFVTTPHVLAEASALLGQLPKDVKGGTGVDTRAQAKLLHVASLWDERFSPVVSFSENPAMVLKFGLTDATIQRVAATGIAILTDDSPLYGVLVATNPHVTNFTHLRNMD
ncbi:MAG: hypothetical protein K2X32_07770 [Phycisphaerales bacterium]|nr:hypothetical protein [Phycisphaerales bacterium]